MSKKEQLKEEAQEGVQEGVQEKKADATSEKQVKENSEEAKQAEEPPKSELEVAQEQCNKLQEELAQLQDKNLRLNAEFENHRRRTAAEKVELIKNAGATIFEEILPLVDNFERALDSIDKTEDIKSLKEGVELIYKDFSNFLSRNGVKEIEAKENDFDTDFHEALTKIPAPTPELKGKVVDVIKKGYKLNDKVIRFSQVVIGE